MDLLGDWWTPLVLREAFCAAEVRERWQAGDRDGAAGLVTGGMVLATTLIGTEDMVREQLRVWRDADADVVRFYPVGETLDARLTALGRAIDLVRQIEGEAARRRPVDGR